jgi:galactokinase
MSGPLATGGAGGGARFRGCGISGGTFAVVEAHAVSKPARTIGQERMRRTMPEPDAVGHQAERLTGCHERDDAHRVDDDDER